MVLSNKKLKQKLKAALAESLVATEARNRKKESTKQAVNSRSQSFKELLNSVTQNPRLSKREKRRKNLPLRSLEPVGVGDGDTQVENKVISSEALTETRKKKKRKREEDGAKEKGNDDAESAEKKPAKKPKKKKKKKKKNQKKNDEGIEHINGDIKEGAAEMVKVDDSQQREDIATKVYVGGIPYYSTEDDIRSFFEGCGTITEIDCMTFPESGKFRGIAMINFKTEAAAKRALALDGADMGGFYLKIQPYKADRVHKSMDFAPEIVEGYNRIYVGNLSWDVTEDDLKKLFSDCQISSIRFGKDKSTGEFRGYAHVDFSDSLSLTLALQLDQQVLCGRPVRIRCAVPKKEKEGHEKSASDNKEAKNGHLSSGTGKKRRRTCYECGVPGHISSDCPKRRATDVVPSGPN